MLRPGDRIGDWEVVLPLGQGGMGSVCRCRHALSHRIEAAVKVLKPTDMAGARERFIREAEALHALSHPAIVRVHGFGLDARTELLWLAMELVSGQNFEFLLQDGEFPSERAAEIFGTVAEGLAYAHSRGIVHRDIKPGNLMLRDDGRAILLDFGIAVQEGHERLTQEGVVPGTVAYAAPEQVTFGTDHDPALSDLYSLGQVLCGALMLTPVALLWPGVSLAPAFQPRIFAAIAANGILSTAAAMCAMYMLIRAAGPASAATINFFTPLIAIVVSALTLGEPLSPVLLAAFALVALGAWLVARTRPRAAAGPA